MRFGNIAAGVLLASLLAIAPTAGDAAWWPWSKKSEKTAPAQPDPAASPADTGATGDRLARIEAQIRAMTGQIEELTFQLNQLQDALLKVQGDADYRLQQLEGGGAKPKKVTAAPAAPAPLAAPASGVLVLPNDAAKPAPAAGPAPPARVVGVIDPSVTPAPIDLTGAATRGTAAATPAAAPASAPAPSPAEVASAPKADVLASLGDPRGDYDTAYNNILTGNYERAEAEFRSFLAAHPDDPRASDAQYWLGESLFARAKYRDAAVEFLNGHNAYPNSPKAPDTLLKLGLSLAGLGERDAACQTYLKVLKQYPNASKALRQRVAVEQASASC
ncbi:MAG TPA: tol-pal system protein YbgF [Bauldia sp.]|nr:tol-pal system protein YbgF [Bauldia sp.]